MQGTTYPGIFSNMNQDFFKDYKFYLKKQIWLKLALCIIDFMNIIAKNVHFMHTFPFL